MSESATTDLQAGQEGDSAASAHPWDELDVSAWFDTSMLADEAGNPLEGCRPEHGFYQAAPGEACLTWWAASHPEAEKEARAASLAASLEQARTKAAQSPGTEAQAHYEKMRDAVLLELKELADKDSVVTANAVLGKWHYTGRNLDKKDEEAAKHLLKAAEAGDPYSACLLANAGFFPERTEELYRTAREAGCPSALAVQADPTDCRHRRLPAAELEDLAAHLAAFAAKKEYNCLAVLVLLLHQPEAAGFRKTYAGFVLDLLNKAAESGVADAYAMLARILLRGVLCRQDAAKAEELQQKALQKGSELAVLQQAARLLEAAQALHGEERAAQMQEAYALLREKGMGSQKASSCACLGHYLTRSGDDKEFQEGMDCLGKCLEECSAQCLPVSDLSVSSAADSAAAVLTQQASPQRRAQALKLLDRIVKAGSAHAMRLKGVCSLMGLCGKEAREQGIDLLLEAGKRGDKEAWSTLAGLYALGLCGFGKDLRKALLMAIAGDKAGSEEARFWRVLLELGEFSESSASMSDLVRDPKVSVQDLAGLLAGGSAMMGVMGSMIWLDASELRSKAAPFLPLPKKPHPAEAFDNLVHEGLQFAQLCVQALKSGRIPLAAFCVHALKKISRTEYGRFYMGPLAVWLGLAQDASPKEVLDFLNTYLAGLPESFFRFRDRKEDPALEKRLAAWASHLRASRNPDVQSQCGLGDGIDVSAWLDTSFLAAAGLERAEAACLSASGFYEAVIPSDIGLTWWAASHPEDEKEAEAACLAVPLELARIKAEQHADDAEAKALHAKQLEAAVQKLEQLADEGGVTANAVLGACHLKGINVGRDLDKAEKHLLLAAEKGEPCSAYALADEGFFPDRTEEFFRKSLECGYPHALVRRASEFLAGLELPAGELEALASWLAAFAARRVYPCLDVLVRILQTPQAESLRKAYAKPVLDLLCRAAASGVARAVELLGFALLDGALCRPDAGKAKELFREAGKKGSASGSYMYAVCLIEEAQKLPEPEKKAKLQEGYALLRENCSEGRCPEKAWLALGRCLVRSDDEEEFKEGMACLGKSLVYKDFVKVLECVIWLVMYQPSPKRRAQALKLLDGMAEAGSLMALHWKGVYSLMGMYGKDARKGGIKLLLEAGQKGGKEAWTVLAEVYAFGLYGFGADLRKALLMAIAGDMAGSERAKFWRVLLELGESSGAGAQKPTFWRSLLKFCGFSKADSSIADLLRDPETSAKELAVFAARDDDMAAVILGRMVWLGASDLRSKAAPFVPLPEKPRPAEDFDKLAADGIQFAQICVHALACGQTALAALCAHALKKISLTEYCQFYAGPLAVMLGLPEDASPEEAAGFINEHLAGLPESFFRFRDREEDPDLAEKLAAWTEHMRTAAEK